MQNDDADIQQERRTRTFFRKISPSLLVLLGISLVTPWLLTGWYGWYHYGNVLRETENNAKRSVVALQEHASNVLETHTLVLHQVASLTNQQTWRDIAANTKLELSLAELVDRFSQLSEIALADRDGQIQMSNRGKRTDISVAEREYFTAHKIGGSHGVFFSEAGSGRLDRESQFTISIARRNATRKASSTELFLPAYRSSTLRISGDSLCRRRVILSRWCGPTGCCLHATRRQTTQESLT